MVSTEMKGADNVEELVMYGYKQLDRITGGIRNGELILVAGRPGMGKSSFSISIQNNYMKNGKKTGLMVVDDLQRLCCRKMPKAEAMGEVLTQLKRFAQEWQCAVIVQSQLSRACETRKDHRPRLSDLPRHLNLTAVDTVLLLYRDAYYEYNEKISGESEILEVLIAKNPIAEAQTALLRWYPDSLEIKDDESEEN